ncbi:hypothetical protein [Sicyoidochytrium minutum DNA virus]|nr:hypothetical protein [Sicyoidochytrium minutum DNA virus]
MVPNVDAKGRKWHTNRGT